MKKKLLFISVFVLFGFISINAQDSVNVTFQVNMSVKVLEGFFDPLTEVVTVPGDFNNWLNEPPANTTKQLEDPDGDSIYTKTIKVGTNATYGYKYNVGLGWDGKDESSNRSVDVVTSDLVLPVVWFDNDSLVSIPGDGFILFEVDMSVMEEVGIFDNVNDSMQVRGNFNGWGPGEPDRSLLFQDPADPNLYFLDVSFTQVSIGDEQNYKFFVNKADTNDLWIDGWERPNNTGGGNRSVLFLGQPNQVAGVDFYDHVSDEWVIESGDVDVSIIFSVDMRPAMDPGLQPIPFDPAADSLYWIGEQPSFVRSQGWDDTNEMRVLLLTDTDGDSIFSGELNVTPPSFNSFVYRYGFVDADDPQLAWVHEPEGFSNFAYRVRYIGQNAPRSFPFSPWNAPTDTWTNAEVKTDQELDPYSTLAGVEDESDLYLNTYTLEQNYPNPFNPSTVIRFNIPETQFVSLKVYNILGEVVATLLDREMNTGVHHVNFNAAGLTSGVYFYSIRTSDFVSTKKMLLIK